jgi:hypothetical protein
VEVRGQRRGGARGPGPGGDEAGQRGAGVRSEAVDRDRGVQPHRHRPLPIGLASVSSWGFLGGPIHDRFWLNKIDPYHGVL